MNELIKELKEKYADKPANFVFRKTWWIAFQIHAFLFFALAIPLVAGWAIYFSVDSVIANIILFLCLFLVTLFQLCIWIRTYVNKPKTPTGVLLTESLAPELIETVNSIAEEHFGGLNLDKILLTSEMNAGACSMRKIFSPWKTEKSIYLGFPLFDFLGVDGIRAIIAHELFHLSDRTSAARTWIRFAEAAIWNAQFMPIHFFVPRIVRKLNNRIWAHRVILDYKNELLADQAELLVSAPLDIGAPLLRFAALGVASLDHAVWKLSNRAKCESPPSDVIQIRRQLIDDFFNSPVVSLKQLDIAIQWPKSIFESHPKLTERISEIGADLEEAKTRSLQREANSMSLLGEHAPKLKALVCESFIKKHAAEWKKTFDFYEHLKADLVPKSEISTIEQAWAHYYMEYANESYESAEKAIQKVLEFEPDNKIAPARAVRCQLMQQKTGAAEKMEALLDSPSLVIAEQAYQDLFRHFSRTGQQSKLFHLERVHESICHRGAMLNSEMQVSLFGEYYEARIPERVKSDLNKAFSEEPMIRTVHVARKRLKHCKETKFYVLAFSMRRFGLSNKKVLARLREKTNTTHATFAFADNPSYSPHIRKIRRVANSLIYSAPENGDEQVETASAEPSL